MDPEQVAGRDTVDPLTLPGGLQQIAEIGIVPVVTLDRVADAEPLALTLLEAGLPCVEITFRTETAAAAIAAISQIPDMLVGAGTVLTVAQAITAVEAGARFLAAPGFDPEVVEWSRSHEVPAVPGVMTPTEVGLAARSGLRVLKFFPAGSAGGVGALGSLGAVYPDIAFMPTGGIEAGNLADYLRLPNVAACGASWVAPRQMIAAGEFADIGRRAAEAVAIVTRVRGAR